jgi:acyl-CoA thioester hydrolase
MHRKGVDAVVARMNLQYKTPLRCDDEFFSRLNLKKEGIKYIFSHHIHRASDDKLCFRASVELVCLVNGKLGTSEDYDKAFEAYIQKDERGKMKEEREERREERGVRV